MAAALLSAPDRLSTRGLIVQLDDLRGHFGATPARQRLACMQALDGRLIRSPVLLRRYHDVLAYMFAFPDTVAVRHTARGALEGCAARVARLSAAARGRLADSGISGTTVAHAFGHQSAEWIVQRAGGDLDIAWDLMDDTSGMDALLARLILHIEEDHFEDDATTTQRWVRMAYGAGASDGAWLVRQVRALAARQRGPDYDAAEVPLRWRLGETWAARTLTCLEPRRVHPRSRGMRGHPDRARRLVWRPLPGVRRLPPDRARRVIDVVTAALLCRAREVYAMRYANPHEVYVADIGRGVTVAVIGVRPPMRLGLEANYGFALLSNGVPVGYGGATTLFCQANTGINIFKEFRRSEAGFMFTQVLRTCATLFGCRHFLVDPFQFGHSNREAIASGAFWFYYRLGFRPLDPAVRGQARREWQRLQAAPGRRTPPAILRTLARGHMVLHAPGASPSECFPEHWLVSCSREATRVIAEQAGANRHAAAARLATRLVRALGGSSWSRYPVAVRQGMINIAPILALADVAAWPVRARRAACKLLESKGAPRERGYAAGMAAHTWLRRSLTVHCRQLERERRRS